MLQFITGKRPAGFAGVGVQLLLQIADPQKLPERSPNLIERRFARVTLISGSHSPQAYAHLCQKTYAGIVSGCRTRLTGAALRIYRACLNAFIVGSSL